jgi:hypothetical protein
VEIAPEKPSVVGAGAPPSADQEKAAIEQWAIRHPGGPQLVNGENLYRLPLFGRSRVAGQIKASCARRRLSASVVATLVVKYLHRSV